MAERTGGRERPNFGRGEDELARPLPETTVAEVDAQYCVCHHTEGAHKAARPGAKRPCAFCRCADFQLPSMFREEDAPLTPAAQRALQILQQNGAFKGLPELGLHVLARHARRRLFLAAQVLMTQGDKSQSLHIIVKGSVAVERHAIGSAPLLLAHLGPGEVVGEMGVLDGSPRSATVVTETDVETLELTAEMMKQTFQEFPEALMAILKLVTERMRNTDALVERTVEIALTQMEGNDSQRSA